MAANQPAASWPNGARCAACLTFDLDAESSWLNRDPRNADRPVVLSQGRYGPKVALGFILELLADCGLDATFFVPGWVIDNHPRAIEAVRRAGQEIAAHGYLHERPDLLPPAQEEEILLRSIAAIERATGERPLGYRSPAWEFSPSTLTLLHRHGFAYSSNMMDDIFPYCHERPGGGRGLVELPVSWLLDDAPFYQYANFMFGPNFPPSRPIGSPREVLSIWQDEYDGIWERGGLFVLTMHPQLSGRPSRLTRLRELIEHIQRRGQVWITSCRAVAAHWQAAAEETVDK